MKATIYHNPRCSKSRQTLALLQDQGVAVEVVEYLKTPLSKAELAALFEQSGETPSTALRRKQAEAKELGVDGEGASVDAILDAMVKAPILVERPFVVADKGARLCRPPERVFEIL